MRGVLMAARGNDSAGGDVEGSSCVHRATEQSARSSADATRVEAATLRRARDGHPYSWEEFVVHYGRRAAWQMWDAAPEVAAAGAAGATEHGVLPGEPHPKSGSPALVPAQRPPGDATLPAGAPATLQGAAAAAATAAFAEVAGAGDDATERTAAAPPPPLEAAMASDEQNIIPLPEAPDSIWSISPVTDAPDSMRELGPEHPNNPVVDDGGDRGKGSERDRGGPYSKGKGNGKGKPGKDGKDLVRLVARMAEIEARIEARAARAARPACLSEQLEIRTLNGLPLGLNFD